MKWRLRKGPVLVIAAVILAVGLGVILSSFFRDVVPRFTGDLEPLLRAGVALFFVGAIYFLIALIPLSSVKPAADDEDAMPADGETRVTFDLKDPATHVAASILILVGAAILLTIAFAKLPDPSVPPESDGSAQPRSGESFAAACTPTGSSRDGGFHGNERR